MPLRSASRSRIRTQVRIVVFHRAVEDASFDPRSKSPAFVQHAHNFVWIWRLAEGALRLVEETHVSQEDKDVVEVLSLWTCHRFNYTRKCVCFSKHTSVFMEHLKMFQYFQLV